MTAQEFWDFIHDWLDEHAPQIRSLVNPSASEQQLALEAPIGQALPKMRFALAVGGFFGPRGV